MILTLEVVGEQAETLGSNRRKVFDSIGGTIGRLPDNDWVFSDPYVSSRHALIRFLNGKFFIEDTSTNGVFLNAPDQRVARGQAHLLRHGDTLYIDSYCIRVSIEQPAAAQAHGNDPFELLAARVPGSRADHTVAQRSSAEDRTAALRDPAEDEDMVATEWLDPQRALPPLRSPAPTVGERGGRPHAPPPAWPAASRDIRAQPAARETAADFASTILAAAGIEGIEPSPQLARTLGEILRRTVDGLMEALRARERAKDHMRVPGTSFQPQHNNPLKFSANVDDAFHNLLVKHNPAYLSPPEAFDDALRDVREHQAAMFNAMRLAFEAMLAKFDPDKLQETFDRNAKKGSILGVPAKLRYWELYREMYATATKNAETGFRTLFGEDFAQAYEEQLQRLHAAECDRNPG